MNWYSTPLSEIIQLLNTTPSGIDNVRASLLLTKYGKNQIEDKKKENHFTAATASVI